MPITTRPIPSPGRASGLQSARKAALLAARDAKVTVRICQMRKPRLETGSTCLAFLEKPPNLPQPDECAQAPLVLPPPGTLPTAA